MRIHYLQHVPFEGLGFIEAWARQQTHQVSSTALFAEEPLPAPDQFDFLVIMGGPMGVHDLSEHAWLTREKGFIEAALGQEKPILGICLGAQLLADVMGARVYPNRHKEIGWHPVTRTASADKTAIGAIVPASFQAFHWHGDTFDLPPGAIHLAESDACRQQAFFLPPAVLGLQFHLESTRESIDLLLRHCGHELLSAPFIQSEADIRSRETLISPSNDLMHAILDFFQQHVESFHG